LFVFVYSLDVAVVVEVKRVRPVSAIERLNRWHAAVGHVRRQRMQP
jgi:hypothetical protein